MWILRNANNKPMILHEKKLTVAPEMVADAVFFMHSKVSPFDVLVVASNEGEFEALEKTGKAKNKVYCKNAWGKMVAKNQGVVFVVTTNQKRRPLNPTIANAWETAKQKFGELSFELMEINGEHVVFFIGAKAKKEKQPEIAEETAQISNETPAEEQNHE